MEIVEVSSGQVHQIVVGRVDKKEVKYLTKARYWFSWRAVAKDFPLFKVTIAGQDEILGVVALAHYPEEKRIEIKLLASLKDSVGTARKYDGIAASLIAFACSEALKNYGEMACVSLVPKTVLKSHYMEKYGMLDAGLQLFLAGRPLFDWAKKNL